MSHGSWSLQQTTRLMAAALEGQTEALEQLAGSPALIGQAAAHRVAPALAVRAIGLGIDGPALDGWRQALRASVARRTMLEASMSRLGAALAAAGVAWAPLKGMGIPKRLYPQPAERPTTDLDVLVAAEDLQAARLALIEQGWQPIFSDPLVERYLLEEGYAWQAADRHQLPLELHYRLWGSVPAELAEAVLARTAADPELGPTVRRISLVDAYIIAAVHTWLTSNPRPLLYWWELHRMAELASAEEVEEIIRRACQIGHPQFVGAAASVASDLWQSRHSQEIASRTLAELRLPERASLSLLRRLGPERSPLAILVAANLLANRPSRARWRTIYRRIWAHPGVVAQSTPGAWPWALRRLAHLTRISCNGRGLQNRPPSLGSTG
jgi:hypothetical protein